MGSQTAAGSSLGISASLPATHDASGYAALTFIEIGQVEKLGTFGAAFAKVEYQPLKGAKQKYKGSADYGALQPSIAIDDADAGQTLMLVAADDETQKLYSFRVTLQDGAKRYFRGRVFGSPETADGADTMLLATPTVEICTRVVRVDAGVTPAPTPSLVINPTSPSIASNAAAGTLVSNITNVPAGATPTVTPNDGRFVIAGDATAGWKVVVGMSALSAGTVNFAVAAAGATGASGVLTITSSQTVLRGVSTANFVVNSFAVAASTSADQAHEYRHRAYVGATGIKANTIQFVLDALRIVQLSPGNAGTEKAASGYTFTGHIEYNGVAYATPTSTVVPDGGSNVLSSVITHPNMVAGSEIYLVLRREYAVGAIPTMTSTQPMNPVVTGNSSMRGALSATTHVGTAGAFVASTNGWGTSLQNAIFGAIVAEPLDKTKPTFLWSGESIEYGLADTPGDGTNGAGGYPRQAIAKTGTKYGSLSLALGAESVLVYNQSNANRRKYYGYGDRVIMQRWGNAYGEGATPQQTWDAVGVLIADMKAAGLTRFCMIAPFPKNRTAAYVTWRDAVNALAPSMCQQLGIELYLNINNGVEATDGTAYWASGMTDASTSGDNGTHPLPAACAIMGSNLRSALISNGWIVA